MRIFLHQAAIGRDGAALPFDPTISSLGVLFAATGLRRPQERGEGQSPLRESFHGISVGKVPINE